MLLKYFYDQELAQASYLVGCAATGEALVIDPSRHIDQYLQTAESEGLTISHVTETHIHADYVSGSLELATATGAKLFLSDAGTDDWKYDIKGRNVIPVVDGDNWMVGNIRVDVLHTPGHTPEHISFMITDTAAADEPIGIFTGDFIFVGDVGRPDLLEEAAGQIGTKEVGARQQFKSVARFKDMPDYLQIWPGHGAGSACGKALGAIPSTTLGYEKRFNPAFQIEDETTFVDWLLDGQPEAPAYFAQMKKVNRIGPALLQTLDTPEHGSREEMEEVIQNGDLLIDFRTSEDIVENFIEGSIGIPTSSSNFSTYVGWFVDYDKPLYIIAADEASAMKVTQSLRSIGVDNIPMFFTPEKLDLSNVELREITASELAETFNREDLLVIDVRGKSEYELQHIEGATSIPLGYLPKFMNDLARDKMIVTQCASGYRSRIAASFLKSNGFTHVANLKDSKDIWSQTLPTVSE